MIDKKTYELMKAKYGIVGSWAVWTSASNTPKSNTCDMSWINDARLLELLDTGFIFVGLNWSSTHGDQTQGGSVAWSNFHSSYAYQQDYKLRYALTDTRFWGSYMTDLIKLYSEVDSLKVRKYLKKNPGVIADNILTFEEEISHLQKDPLLVAMGSEAYQILQNNLGHKYQVIQIRHYSSFISKENYRKEVLKKLDY